MQLVGPSPPAAPRPPSGLLVEHQLALHWTEEAARYLGFTLLPYAPGRRSYGKLEAHGDWVRQRLGLLRCNLVERQGGVTFCPGVPGYLEALKQLVYNKALYAAPVLDLDLTAVDMALNKHVRSVLVLPPSYTSSPLRWELRLLPGALQAVMRAMRRAHTLVR